MKRQTVISQMYNMDKLVVEVSPAPTESVLTYLRGGKWENKSENPVTECD